MKILEKFLLISRPGRAEIQWTKTLESQTLKKETKVGIKKHFKDVKKL